MSTDNTRQLGNAPSPRAFEASSETAKLYYTAALQWFLYPTWTIDEAANLLSGCLPKRALFQPGESNQSLDQKVIETENLIRLELGKSLDAVNSKKYFAPVQVQRDQLMAWVLNSELALPRQLSAAYLTHSEQAEGAQYATPCLEAIDWVTGHFWHSTDLREPPTIGEIIQALLQRYPDLDYDECRMVEYVCRHPVTRQESPSS